METDALELANALDRPRAPQQNRSLHRRQPRCAGMRTGIPRKFWVYRSDAPSGGEGLELASHHSVDVVIVDYTMPEMNGHEVAIEMRRLRPQAPIIMLSGAVDVPEQALKCVDAFIAKGQVARQLLPTIAQLQGD